MAYAFKPISLASLTDCWLLIYDRINRHRVVCMYIAC